MRKETITRNIYKYDELDDDTKETVRERFAADWGYDWAKDAIESIQALAVHFGGKVKDYDIDFFGSSHSSMSFSMPDYDYLTEYENDAETEIRERLEKLGEYNPETLKGLGECKLTGYCADEDAIDGFRIAWHQGERDLDKLMQSAFDSWLKSCQSDCEYQYSDEAFSEMCDSNDYEFYENGQLA